MGARRKPGVPEPGKTRRFGAPFSPVKGGAEEARRLVERAEPVNSALFVCAHRDGMPGGAPG